MTGREVRSFSCIVTQEWSQGSRVEDGLHLREQRVQLVILEGVGLQVLSKEHLHSFHRGFPQTTEVRCSRWNVVPLDLIGRCEIGDGFFCLLRFGELL